MTELVTDLHTAPFLPELLEGAGPPLLWLPEFLTGASADHLQARVQAEIAWEAREVNFGGRKVPVPRLVAWFGAEAYRYGGFTHRPAPFPPVLAALLPILHAAVSRYLGACPPFNSVLLNQYRDGRDSMSFHSDNEVQLGPEPVIASLSLGAPRTFVFRRIGGRQRLVGRLTHGSLLVMHGRSQADWQHAIPKEAASGPRINLTFRHTGPLQPGRLRLPPAPPSR